MTYTKKLSISVMASPARSQYFQYLKEQLGAVPFAIDDGCGITENCKRAWKLYDPTAEYHVVIQDDAIICKDFIPRATGIIEHYTKEKLNIPNDLAYNFYYGTRQRLAAEAAEAASVGYHLEKGEPLEHDFKIYSYKELTDKVKTDWPFMSSDNEATEQLPLREYLAQKFPERTEYEMSFPWGSFA